MHEREWLAFYSDWDDCTDMSDEEFLEYVIKTTSIEKVLHD